MKRSIAVLAASLVLLAATAACGGDDATVGTGSGAGDEVVRPTGGEVVVQIVVDGGFVPVEVALSSVPTVTVLGDGTVITGAPVPAIYPGPAIAPLQQATLDAAGVDRLVARAEALGLLEGPLDFGRPPVADAPDTTVTIAAGGTTHRHVAYALGITDRQPAGGGLPGLTAAQVANRTALSEFVEAANALPPGREAWVPSAIAVYDLGAYELEPQLPQPQVAWPLSRPPATASSGAPPTGARPCTLVEGDQAATLLDALSRANARTSWIVNGTARSLAFRPVVPGQPGCPA
ncbi:MAG: hypothetical protein ACLGI2_17315 [Acidimicrobiia bacterium]